MQALTHACIYAHTHAFALETQVKNCMMRKKLHVKQKNKRQVTLEKILSGYVNEVLSHGVTSRYSGYKLSRTDKLLFATRIKAETLIRQHIYIGARYNITPYS